MSTIGDTMAYHCFNPGIQYRAKDGRMLCVYAGCNDELLVYEVTGVGQARRVGMMTTAQLAGLLVSPPKGIA